MEKRIRKFIDVYILSLVKVNNFSDKACDRFVAALRSRADIC